MTLAKSQQKRVVSLIASATEIVTAVGRGDWLVGRSHECDFPIDVLSLPALTAPKFEVSGSSTDIDARVMAIVKDGLSVYRVDADALKVLAPDVIVTQDQCEVCAVSLKDVAEATCRWAGQAVNVVSLRPNGLIDIYDDIMRVAESIDADEAGRAVVARMKDRLDQIQRRTAVGAVRPSVVFIEWIEPLMTGGNWMPDLIAIAGGRDLLGVPNGHSPLISWDDLAAADPDVVIVAPCGFDIPRTLQEMPLLQDNQHWSKLKAVRENRVAVGDGNALFNRPGPRIVETAEILAEILHPDLAAFGHETRGWVRLSPQRQASTS
jgi:iron complex transport system substrate-binding protein